MSDFLTFRKMITPIIIQVLFWIGVGICAISGLIIIVSGATSYSGGVEVLIGLVLLLVGPLVVSIYCELLIVFFRMNETLNEIKIGLLSSPPAFSQARSVTGVQQ